MENQKELFMDSYERFADAIYRHCFFRVYSRHTAEDLMQETFVKTWQYLCGGKEVENMRAFLYRVANNCIVDHVRKKKTVSLDALLEEDRIEEPESDDHVKIRHSSEMREVLEKLSLLPEEERELVVMRFIDDMGPGEIADILGTNANNVSVKLNRIVAKLKLI